MGGRIILKFTLKNLTVIRLWDQSLELMSCVWFPC